MEKQDHKNNKKCRKCKRKRVIILCLSDGQRQGGLKNSMRVIEDGRRKDSSKSCQKRGEKEEGNDRALGFKIVENKIEQSHVGEQTVR